MKYLITLLLLYWGASSAIAGRTFDKLAAVNSCWKEQGDVQASALPAYRQLTETEWIKLHLALVEQTLRNRSVAGLNASQLQHRLKALDNLHEYRIAGRFPQNEDYSYRTPIFIDKHNTFCAVGYLVKASGHEAVSRKISAATNLAYVKDMHYPELDQWASDYGFTKEELAWIQPGYPPGETAEKVGEGVNGAVVDMYADDAAGKLYVGGAFTQVDGTIAANNIAYVTEQNGTFTWHNMGTGVNGKVNAIVKHNGNIYVAGKFSMAGGQGAENIAYWDGQTWHSLGCTYGEILDLIVYRNELYASGDFDICAALSDVNFAKWNGTNWQQMPELYGRVNTMEIAGGDLVLGGAFTYQQNTHNIIRWNPEANFQPYSNDIVNEVMDLQWYGDTLFAACKQTSPVQLNSPLAKWNGAAWAQVNVEPLLFTAPEGPVSFNSLCLDGDKLAIGGDFMYNPLMGVFGQSFITIDGTNVSGSNWFLLDSAVNKMVRFKNELYVGGNFNVTGEFSNVIVNGIAKRKSQISSIPDIKEGYAFQVSPNPSDGRSLNIENNFDANLLMVTDISGRTLLALPLKNKTAKQQVSLPGIASGVYILGVSNEKGQKVMKKIVVK